MLRPKDFISVTAEVMLPRTSYRCLIDASSDKLYMFNSDRTYHCTILMFEACGISKCEKLSNPVILSYTRVVNLGSIHGILLLEGSYRGRQ